MGGVVVLCTANQCRSPVASGFLRQRFEESGIELDVSSAGFLDSGVPSPTEVIRAAVMFGLDLTSHLSSQIDWTTIRDADLIVTMTRRHVREVAVREPPLWHRTFTIRELIRRGEKLGSRPPGTPLSVWIDEAHDGRTPADLLGSDPSDEVTDPMGGVQADYNEMAETLYGLTRELVMLIWPRSFA